MFFFDAPLDWKRAKNFHLVSIKEEHLTNGPCKFIEASILADLYPTLLLSNCIQGTLKSSSLARWTQTFGNFLPLKTNKICKNISTLTPGVHSDNSNENQLDINSHKWSHEKALVIAARRNVCQQNRNIQNEKQ